MDEDYKEYMLLCKEYVGSGDSEDIDSWEIENISLIQKRR